MPRTHKTDIARFGLLPCRPLPRGPLPISPATSNSLRTISRGSGYHKKPSFNISVRFGTPNRKINQKEFEKILANNFLDPDGAT